MKLNINKLFKKLVIFAFVIYFAITLYNQQKTLNSYKSSIAGVEKEIEEKTEYKDSLVSIKENANSLEYIEKVAREKLQMYKPDEKVYRDISGSNS